MVSIGIGWRHPHYGELLASRPALDFIEVHSENFFGEGGAALALLHEARETYPVSLHGVGLALGSATGVDSSHLDRLERLVNRIDPFLVSDHACFSRGLLDGQSVHASDLLPIPFSGPALDVMCANVQRVQERLKRPLLVENLSAYVWLPDGDRSETEFLGELVGRTGCQLLVDVNNIYVNALNAKLRGDDHDPVSACERWLDGIPRAAVGEIHLAGHCAMDDIVIDDHGSRVCEDVWQVYRHALRRFGVAPSLIEWDTGVPQLSVLLEEAQLARSLAHNAPVEACA